MYRLRLVNDDETDELDLLGGPLRVVNWGWNTRPSPLQQKQTVLPFGNQAMSVGYSPAIESLNLVANGCQDDIRAAVCKLETFLENAAAHHDDPVVYSPQWIEWVTPGENAKRSLLTGGVWNPVTQPPIWPMLEGELLRVDLALTRHPLWENVTATTDSETALSSVGGTWTLAATAGRVPARLALTRLTAGEDIIYPYMGGLDPLTKFWIGFRPEYRGLTGWTPLWECESVAGGGYSVLIDANTLDNPAPLYVSSQGSTAQTTFAAAPDPTILSRLSITINDIVGVTGGTRSHFAGRYLVLCRCWVDSGSAALQMRYGYAESTNVTSRDPVMVSNTHALYKELGTIQIPTPGLWPETGLTPLEYMCRYFTIWLYSQNVDAVTMDMDALVLIPSDYFIKLEDAKVYSPLMGLAYDSLVRTLPNERIIAYSDAARLGFSVSPNQWYLPQGDSMLVIAAEEAADQVIDDVIDVSLEWFPRWTSYRD